jgi:hypothetical protein
MFQEMEPLCDSSESIWCDVVQLEQGCLIHLREELRERLKTRANRDGARMTQRPHISPNTRSTPLYPIASWSNE